MKRAPIRRSSCIYMHASTLHWKNEWRADRIDLSVLIYPRTITQNSHYTRVVLGHILFLVSWNKQKCLGLRNRIFSTVPASAFSSPTILDDNENDDEDEPEHFSEFLLSIGAPAATAAVFLVLEAGNRSSLTLCVRSTMSKCFLSSAKYRFSN